MRYLLVFVVSALCFCSASPTSPNKTDSGKQPFDVCLTGYNGGTVEVYPFDSVNYSRPVQAKLLTLQSGECKVLDVPDGTQLVAYYVLPNSHDYAGFTRKVFMAHAGDYWNL